MPRTRRAAPGRGLLADRLAAKLTDQAQHDTGPAATGTIQSAYRWAATSRRRTLERELVDAWLTSVTERAS